MISKETYEKILIKLHNEDPSVPFSTLRTTLNQAIHEIEHGCKRGRKVM